MEACLHQEKVKDRFIRIYIDIVKKYGGFINRQNEDGVFATEVMPPLI